MYKILYLPFLTFVHLALSANIVVLYHPLAISHSMFMNRTGNALSARGHNVTFLHAPMTDSSARLRPASEQNFVLFNKFIDPALRRNFQEILDDLLWQEKIDIFKTYRGLLSAAKDMGSICRLLDNAEVQKFLRDLRADLVILDASFVACIHNLPEILNVPYLESVGISFIINQAVEHACPYPASYATGHLIQLRNPLTFFERIKNVFDLLGNLFVGYIFFSYASVQVAKPISPWKFAAKMSNVSYYLVNDNVYLLPPRPFISTVRLIGGQFLHDVDERAGALDKGLERFISRESKGLILVSMTTMSESQQMPHHFKRTLVSVFKKLKDYGIIWRFESDIPEVANFSHIKLVKWMPMHALLACKKTAALITHGGINSVLEASYMGVPIVGIPLYGDQPAILDRASVYGGVEVVRKEQLTHPSLMAALGRVLHGKRRRNGVRKLRSFLTDRIMNPLDEGRFWSEFVLRHRGNPHKPYGAKLNFFVYYHIDLLLPLVVYLGFCLLFLCNA